MVKKQKNKKPKKTKPKITKSRIIKKTNSGVSKQKRKSLIPIGGMPFSYGLMIRSPRYMAFAIRDDVGRIELASFKIHDIREKHPTLSLPFIRGIFSLLENIYFFLKISFHKRSFEKRVLREKTRWQRIVFKWNKFVIYFMAILLLFGFFNYIYMKLHSTFIIGWEGFIYNSIFTIFFVVFLGLVFSLLVLSRKDRIEILEYHAVEHKIINSYEKFGNFNEESIEKSPYLHERCDALIIFWAVIFFSFILAFLRVGVYNWMFGILVSVGIVFIAYSVAYEFVRFIILSKNRLLSNIFLWPFLAIQGLLVYSPDSRHINIGLIAIKEVLKLEKA